MRLFILVVLFALVAVTVFANESEQSEQSTSSKSSENSDENQSVRSQEASGQDTLEKIIPEETNVVADGSGQGEEKNAETEASGEKDEE